MKLQILVPQYKEDDSIIKPLLDSLAIQQNVHFDDFSVIIVNDGSDVFLTDEFLKSYPYRIDYYKEEHRGVSGTRNSCLDHAKAEYVMFCDADDMFASVIGIWAIINEINNGGFDTMSSIFIEESQDQMTGNHTYINRENDSTFVHGKVHRRRYLYEQNIRWNESLTIHEDSYFNVLCQRLTKNGKYMQTPFYLWRWRDESVCRRDYQYLLETYTNMIDSISAIVAEFNRRGMPDVATQYAISGVYDVYYNLNKPEWQKPENAKYLEKTERRFARYIKENIDTIARVDPQVEYQTIAGIRQRMFNEGLKMEVMTFNDWMSKINGYIAELDAEEKKTKGEEVPEANDPSNIVVTD